MTVQWPVSEKLAQLRVSEAYQQHVDCEKKTVIVHICCLHPNSRDQQPANLIFKQMFSCKSPKQLYTYMYM